MQKPILERPSGTTSSSSADLIPTWATLKNHCLLTTVRIGSEGEGSLWWLALLMQCFLSSPALAEWLQEANHLLNALRKCKLKTGSALSTSQRQDPLWQSINTCIDARKRSAGATALVDGLLVKYVIGAAEQGSTVSVAFVSGLAQLYKARSDSQSSRLHDWRELLVALQGTSTDLTAYALRENPPVCREFAVVADRVLKTPPISVTSVKNLRVLRGLANQQGSPTGLAPFDVPDRSAIPPAEDPPTTSEEKDAVHRGADVQGTSLFSKGDSVGEYLRQQAPFTARRIRLGLERRSSAQIQDICEIVRLCAVELGHTEIPSQQAAICMLLLQLCAPLPFHVLLSLRCTPGDEIWLNLQQGVLVISQRLMTAESARHVWFSCADTWSIPLPVLVAEQLTLWKGSSSRYLSEVFSTIGVDLNELESRHRETLRRFSDTNLQVWPGQWISGLCSAAVQVLGSELSAAFVLSQPGLAAPGAIHYFHPRQDDLNRLTYEWLGHFGLRAHGQPNLLKEEPVNVFDNERLSTGFSTLISDVQELSASISRNRGNEVVLLSDFKALTTRIAALLVFTTASRGSRLDELKCGSLLAHGHLLHVEDKEVADGRGSRLLPKLDIHHWLLNSFLRAQTLVSERLVRSLPKGMRSDVLLELADQELRFEAGLFQHLERNGRRLMRRAVPSADVEDVAREYFQAPRNFMRHVLITHWTLEREDNTVLRALTGHAWASAEAPGPCATYAPSSVIAAIKAPLERLLATWVVSPTQSQRHHAWPTHRLPLRRLFKVHGHYRKIITEGLQGPVFSRWHLAATVLAERIRHDLCTGQLPLRGKALMWLHLVFVDGLTEQQDLEKVLEGPEAISRGACCWTARWRRESDHRGDRLIALQAPSSLFLESHWRSVCTDATESIGIDLAQWLSTLHPELPYGDCTPERSKAILLAVASLWSDLAIPSALQTAYAVDTNAPIPSLRSAERLLNRVSRHTPPAQPPVLRAPNPFDTRSELVRLLKLIHKVGDSQQRLGEQKARAAYFLEHSADLSETSEGSWTAVLINALRQNIDLIRKGNRKALQLSSVSTYVSSITDFINDHQDLNLREIDEQDLQLLSIQLLGHAHRKDGAQKSDVQSAALWLLRSLEQQGYRVLLRVPDASDWRHRSGVVRAVPWFDAADLDAARTTLESIGTGAQLRYDQQHLLIDLLQQVPLRWMEAAALDVTHILLDRPALRIEPSGFGHIKSASSIRTLALPEALHQRLLDLARRVMFNNASSRPLLFSDAPADGVQEAAPSSLNEDLAWVMKYVLGDDFRIHDFRANVVSSLIFPGWSKVFTRWIDHQASGKELRSLFEYSSQAAWMAERISVVAGHSHPIIGVSYYVFIWPLLRCLALASLNAHLIPGPALLRQASMSSAALCKALQRSSDTASNPWNHLASKRLRRVSSNASDALQPTNTASRMNSTEISGQASRKTPIDELKLYRLLCLCSSGLPLDDSIDLVRIESHHRESLNSYLASLDAQDLASLRRREGVSNGRRSAAAELDLIRSQAFERLFKVLSAAASDQLRSLLGLLSRRSDAEAVSESSLSEVAGIFDESDFQIEVIFGQRHFDAAAAVRLSACKSLVVGKPVRDQGRTPRAFIVFRFCDLSLVAKARWRSVAAQLTYHLVRCKRRNAWK